MFSEGHSEKQRPQWIVITRVVVPKKKKKEHQTRLPLTRPSHLEQLITNRPNLYASPETNADRLFRMEHGVSNARLAATRAALVASLTHDHLCQVLGLDRRGLFSLKIGVVSMSGLWCHIRGTWSRLEPRLSTPTDRKRPWVVDGSRKESFRTQEIKKKLFAIMTTTALPLAQGTVCYHRCVRSNHSVLQMGT